ncbi:hypothetical protein [Actinomyces respiraculi]|nr:hypothetical protein [Actinomyces respiraculi]
MWELLRGRFEPSGLLPASMTAVERHCGDLPFDDEAYTDVVGNRYAFGFGLGWDGVIDDERTHRYRAGS